MTSQAQSFPEQPMNPDLIPCTHCHGSGRMKIHTTTIGEGAPRHSDIEIRCIYCQGHGQVTRAQQQAEERERALWCTCGTPSGRVPIFRDDGQCLPTCYHKHHYHCADCGKVVQIG